MADTIRVLHYFAFPGGGIGRYVHELLSHMVEVRDMEVELACIPSYHHRQAARYAIWPGLRDITHPSPWRRRVRFAINLVVNPLRAIRRARETGAQILHLSTIPHVTFAWWGRALRRSGITLVATAHDVRRSQGLIHLGYELEELKRLYRTCAAIFVHSEHQKRDLMDFAGVPAERVVIVPHGPYYHGRPQGDKQSLRRRYGVPVDKQVALFFGDIRPDKNLDLFLRAMVPFRDRLFLVVAGQAKNDDGKDATYYKKLANGLGLADCVRWRLEYIPDEEVPDYLELCDWVAMPYSSRFTSQSGVLNVAVAHRRPVLVTSTPTIAQTLARAEVGVCVDPDDLRSLTDGIARLLARQPESFCGAMDKYLQTYSWQTNATVAVDTYREVLR